MPCFLIAHSYVIIRYDKTKASQNGLWIPRVPGQSHGTEIHCATFFTPVVQVRVPRETRPQRARLLRLSLNANCKSQKAIRADAIGCFLVTLQSRQDAQGEWTSDRTLRGQFSFPPFERPAKSRPHTDRRVRPARSRVPRPQIGLASSSL